MRTLLLILIILRGIGMLAGSHAVSAASKIDKLGLFISPMGEPFRVRPETEERPFTAWFVAADRNHDEKIDSAEFQADAVRFFRILDSDGDGRIGAVEMRHYEEKIVPEIHRPKSGRSPPSLAALMQQTGGRKFGKPDPEEVKKKLRKLEAKRPKGLEMFGLLPIPHPVASADSDLNFVISEAEFVRAADLRFEALDRDGDSLFTPADARQVLKKAQGGGA